MPLSINRNYTNTKGPQQLKVKTIFVLCAFNYFSWYFSVVNEMAAMSLFINTAMRGLNTDSLFYGPHSRKIIRDSQPEVDMLFTMRNWSIGLSVKFSTNQ